MSGPDVVVMMFDYVPSGVVTNALRIAEAAQRDGLTTEIWTVQGVGNARADVPVGVTPKILGSAIGEDYSRKDRRVATVEAVGAFASALQERQPRIALSAGNHFHELAVRAAELARPAWTGRLIGRMSNALPRFSWAPHKLPWSIYKRAKARRRLDAIDRLIAVSAGLRLDLIRQLLIPASKISVIPNGIDLADARRRATEPLDHPWFHLGQPPVVLGVGRMVPQKGFEELLSAFAEARRGRPMRLMLLGDGPERSRLEELARTLGIADDVAFTGYVSNPLPYLRQAALFVLSSRWEGMSNALLEALAVGCISIATRCSGSMELLGGRLSGQIVPVGNRRALASAIVTNLKAPPDEKLFSDRAAAYDLKATLKAYVDLLREEAGKC